MAAMDIKRDDNPNNSFLGKSLPKSFSWCLDVRMARNMTTAVTEKHRAMRDAIEKTLKAGWFSRVGTPSPSLTPPGTVADVANATVAMRAATTEHELEVLLSHSPPFSTRSAWLFVNISLAVLLLLL
ncbi:hypothetical protein PVL29_008363 [Vitis rotundifolia]|uniref:Uncharacterized protein n=1 Tax=Vitis rotundifolia TaxID=103349 RepID=A0AA38ZWF3_VITRO|nr:hypothetical protein PVL29_008363 [Vitis rotundifolia]